MKNERRNPGILCVDEKYELTAHVLNAEQNCWTYTCKYRSTPKVKCPVVAKVVFIDEKWRLAAPGDNHKCEPNRARVTAENL